MTIAKPSVDDATRGTSAPGATGPASAPPADVSAALEMVETRAWSALYEAAPDAIRAAARLSLVRFGDLVVGAAPAFDVLAFNRLLGAAPGTFVEEGALVRLAEHFRGLGLGRAFLPWPATVRPATPPSSAVPIVFHNRWVKLWRDAAPPPTVRSGLRCAPLSPVDGDGAAAVLASAFDFPPPLVALFAAAIGRSGWRHFGLFAGSELVAMAGLFVAGDCAWLGPAATHPGHRGLGAQQELLSRRIEAAGEAGCRLLTVETAEPTPERPVASYRNVRRLGFAELYRRCNYRLDLAAMA